MPLWGESCERRGTTCGAGFPPWGMWGGVVESRRGCRVPRLSTLLVSCLWDLVKYDVGPPLSSHLVVLAEVLLEELLHHPSPHPKRIHASPAAIHTSRIRRPQRSEERASESFRLWKIDFLLLRRGSIMLRRAPLEGGLRAAVSRSRRRAWVSSLVYVGGCHGYPRWPSRQAPSSSPCIMSVGLN